MIKIHNTGHVTLEFGTGDINVIPAIMLDNGLGVVGFRNQEQREIGLHNGDSIEDIDMFQCPVLLTFSKVESIDVVIHALEEIKKLIAEQRSEGVERD